MSFGHALVTIRFDPENRLMRPHVKIIGYNVKGGLAKLRCEKSLLDLSDNYAYVGIYEIHVNLTLSVIVQTDPWGIGGRVLNADELNANVRGLLMGAFSGMTVEGSIHPVSSPTF